MVKSGPSISAKLILRSTLVTLVVVAGFAVLSVHETTEDYRQRAEERARIYKAGLLSKGRSLVMTFARGAAGALSESRDQVAPLLDGVMVDDPALVFAFIVGREYEVLAHSDENRYPRDGASFPRISDQLWEEVAKYWREQGTKNGRDALVPGIEHMTARGEKTLVFAFPVVAAGSVLAPSDLLGHHPELLGYAVVGYSLATYDQFAADAVEHMSNARASAAKRTGLLGLLFVLVGAVFAVIHGISMSRPLKLLAWRVGQFSAGDLGARAEVNRRDEIGVLGESFNQLAERLEQLLSGAEEAAKLAKEMEVARAVQDSLVPSDERIEMGPLQLAGYFDPASICGGDWWTYEQLGQGRILVVIGDVTGHGVPSAMITATAKSAVDVALDLTGSHITPSRLLGIMNSAIIASAKRKFVMTCFAAIIDLDLCRIEFANAGHNFPYLVRRGDGDERAKFQALTARGNRLGDVGDSAFESKTITLQAGDFLVFYSDGIVECESEQGEEYGEKRFRSAISEHTSKSPDSARDAIVAAAKEFYGAMPHKDDITLVVAKLK